MSCRHKYNILREHKVANILGDGQVNTILQCEKCLKVFIIEEDEIKEISVPEKQVQIEEEKQDEIL